MSTASPDIRRIRYDKIAGLVLGTLCLLFFCCLSHAQQRIRLTLDAQDVSLDMVLKDIQRKTGYLYIVDKECIRTAGKLSFSVHNATVADAMDSILGNLPIYYRLIRKSINVFPGSMIWGQVIDERGQGIAAATVMVSDGDPLSATVTDEQGKFRLRLLGQDRPLVVSCIGYGSREYRVSGAQQLQVQLSRQAGELSGVVVSNGFEELPAERATGSFTRLGRELIGRRPSANILDRMDGVTSSLLVNKNVQAGINQSAITIRGRSTIFSNPDPLVVVDNFPYSGDINNINPEDIESVTVLKDAAAASVWGTRAANGVIVLKTKQGAYKQAPRLSVTSSLTVGRKPDLYYTPILSPADYIGMETFLFNQGWYDNTILSLNHYALSPVVEILQQQREGQLSGSDTAALLGQLRGQDSRRDLGRYWYRQSVNQQYWIGLSGGTASNRYALSAGLDQDAANLTRNAYRRVTVTGNQTYLVAPHLELNTSLAFTASSTYLNNDGGGPGPYPYLKLADAAGNALAVPDQLREGYVDTVGGGRLLDWHYRPLDELRDADNVIRLTDWRLNAGLHYTMGKRWQVRALYQFGQGSSDQQNLQSLQTYYTRNLINEFTQTDPSGQLSYPVPVGGILDETLSSYQSHNGRLQLEYHPLLGDDHDLHVLVGSELQDVESRTKLSRVYGYNSASQTGLPVSSYKTLYPQYSSPGSVASIPYPDNNVSASDHYWSYYGNIGYQYRQRYTVTMSARLDQSNLFGVDINHKTLPLWSAGVAWETSREAFYHVGWLPLLRLRVTNGYNGNVYKAVSGYTTTADVLIPNITSITTGFLNTYGTPAAIITNPPNPHLRWEQVHVVNAGIDFAGKDSVLQGSLEYYSKQGQYLIGPASLDPTTGNVQYTANVANMTTHGLDISLHSHLQIGSLQWNSIILFNYVRDKVTRYLVQPPTILSFLNTQTINPLVGHPLYSLYALGWAGLDPQTGNPRGWLNGHTSQDYTSLISSPDFRTLLYQGPVNPPLFGSWRNDFGWRRWGLSVNITYKFGHYFIRPSIQYVQLFYGTSRGHPDYERRWQHPGDELHTNVPSMIYPADVARDSYYSAASVLVEKGDFIRLQDIQLYYDFSRKTLPKLPVHALRLYAYANNIGLLWKANHQGTDPDALTGLPDPRTLAVGVKLEL